jgi:hypothetical protein
MTTSIHAVQTDFTSTAATPSARIRLRSAGAVLGGLLSTFVATTAVDLVLHATGVFPPYAQIMSDALFVLAIAYRIPLNIAGCYLAARLAPYNPRAHALALGFVGLLLSSVGAIAMWKFGPAWYSLGNILVALPCAWVAARRFQSVR